MEVDGSALQPRPAPSDSEKLRALPWSLGAEVLNTFFYLWTFGGSVFLLFLSELGLPKGQIGALLAAFPFAGVLALGFAPVATRWGWKRAFLACYGGRKVVMAMLLFLPWVMAHGGRTAGVWLLYGVIITVALLRALAETALYPWIQDFVPNRVRGKYTGVRLVLFTATATLSLLIAGRVIGPGASLPTYLGLIGGGCALGFLGVVVMVKVPGGEPRPDVAEGSQVGAGDGGGAADDGLTPPAGSYRNQVAAAMRDGNFVSYLGGVGAVTLGTALVVSFLPLYVKEQFGIAPGTVVALDTVVMVGGGLASLLLGWAADRVGSRPVLMPTAALTILVPLGWLLLPRQLAHPVVWCAALYFLYGTASYGMFVGAGRLLFNGVIPPARSTAYTAIYYAWIGFTGGIGPLMAGLLLSATRGWRSSFGGVVIDSHSILFLLAFALIAVGWGMYSRVRPDDVHTTRTAVRLLMTRLLGLDRGKTI